MVEATVRRQHREDGASTRKEEEEQRRREETARREEEEEEEQMDTSAGVTGLVMGPQEGRVCRGEVTAVMARAEASPEVAHVEITSVMAREVVTPEIARAEAPMRRQERQGRNSEVKDAISRLGGRKSVKLEHPSRQPRHQT